ncbi:hypothetical protein GUY94_002510 [Salmonella enterica]|nr:hypothetical protein [Salmonella enterica]EEH0056091.1 hypothetical protein [Salmonella enterica]ELT2735036.1 hypothetical protein [Salmonella enterica]
MKGIDFGRMTPEKMGELIAAATRQLEVMNESGQHKEKPVTCNTAYEAVQA